MDLHVVGFGLPGGTRVSASRIYSKHSPLLDPEKAVVFSPGSRKTVPRYLNPAPEASNHFQVCPMWYCRCVVLPSSIVRVAILRPCLFATRCAQSVVFI